MHIKGVLLKDIDSDYRKTILGQEDKKKTQSSPVVKVQDPDSPQKYFIWEMEQVQFIAQTNNNLMGI